MGLQVDELVQGKQPWEKEFIDFQFDGKNISDFGMVAVSSGDRYQFSAAPNFEDETSIINGVDGQYYWGTHLGTITRTFNLATDGITETQMELFKRHFRPGRYGRFVEDYLSQRYSYCRLANPPSLSFVPFREEKTFRGQKFYTNIFRGEGSITFIWDVPYTYSIKQYYTDEEFLDSPQLVARGIYKNQVPLNSSWINEEQCFIGGGKAIRQNKIQDGSLLNSDHLIFYNPSTISSKVTLKQEYLVELTEVNISNWKEVLFCSFADEENYQLANYLLPYNSFFMTESQSIDEHQPKYKNEFRFSSPGIFKGLNKAIILAKNSFLLKHTGIEFEERLRDQIINERALAWSISILRIIKSKPEFYDIKTDTFKTGTIKISAPPFLRKTGTISANWFIYFNIMILAFFAQSNNSNYLLENPNSWGDFFTQTITFDGQSNRVFLKYDYNKILSKLEKFSELEENCSEVMASDYLKLDGGDNLTEDGLIIKCHYLKFFKGGRENIVKNTSMFYEYTYL